MTPFDPPEPSTARATTTSPGKGVCRPVAFSSRAWHSGDLIYLGFVDHFTRDVSSACAHLEAARRLHLGGKVAAAVRKGMALAGGCAEEKTTTI